jgi:hypothetical protein
MFTVWAQIGTNNRIRLGASPMTIEELNDLIARGAAQPGIREVEEMMRLSRALDEQARELSFGLCRGTDRRDRRITMLWTRFQTLCRDRRDAGSNDDRRTTPRHLPVRLQSHGLGAL